MFVLVRSRYVNASVLHLSFEDYQGRKIVTQYSDRGCLECIRKMICLE